MMIDTGLLTPTDPTSWQSHRDQSNQVPTKNFPITKFNLLRLKLKIPTLKGIL